ncbi:TadE/TadG family type IV pilus assembly protein [Plantactinospora sp. CA-290183]|uniref:TadE/TadG family type IV pilus assembly protein n=1 Tax=Plantactinospora sp. CA-290183 TaxID=3240006 RepID=UPI003D90913E
MTGRGPADGRRAARGRGADRGSVSVEVAILAPAFLALVALAGVAGRTAIANEAIEVAAHDAARAASISRTADEAREQARQAVQDRLRWEGLACAEAPELAFAGTLEGERADVDEVFASALGADASVIVTVSCDVSVGNLRMPLLPRTPEYTAAEATFASPLDRYRSRGQS